MRRQAVPGWSVLARAQRVAQLARSAASGTYLTAAHGAFPVVDGRFRLLGLQGRVDVIRDRYGVPHIFGATDEDALFGQGLVHAQDRMFQMDGARRLAAGRLSEIAGPRALRGDRFLRRLGLARVAARDVAEMSADDRGVLDAYARGVNEGIRTLPALPPEFVLAGYEPEPWSAEDTMMIARLVLVSFATNWDTELVRERLAAGLGAEQAAALDPVHDASVDITVTHRPYPPAADRLLEAYRAAIDAGLPLGVGSNAWVVSGERSQMGAPLLASDPHVGSSLPGLFHISHVSGDRADAVGADIPGVPGVVIGHNQAIAWGITAGMANVADCYVEEFDPEQPTRYRTPDGWTEAQEYVEQIAVRGGGTVEERVLETRHGPVIGPALAGESRAIALRSTALERGDLVRGFLGLWRARDLEAFEQAADDWSGTTFNIVFAHTDGSIGYRFIGSVPVSERGEGLLPRDGATSPGPPPVRGARELPRLMDPPEGVIASANQAPGGTLELGEEWCEPQRAARITELIERRGRHSVASFQRMQVDRYSAHLVSLRDLLLARGAVAHPEGPLLEAWDGMLSPRDPAAAIISLTFEELARTLAERAAGSLAPLVLGAGLEGLTTYTSFHYRLQGAIVRATVDASAPWYDGEDDRDRRLIGAVMRAVGMLRERFGPHPARWHGGLMHPLALDHPLRAIPALGRWFSRGPIEYGGDVNTVWQAAYSTHVASARTRVTAAYRQVIDLGDFDRSTFILLTGNSGIPAHPRYDDCLGDYLAGRQRPMLYTRAAVEAAAESWLVLEPERLQPESPTEAGGRL